MAHQSLYRRYRPRRFAELKGQEHVVGALRNAVSDDTAGHAYLFSGPRGTGKTSTARILAKALNCTNLSDGEPCCECESCVAMEAGSSFDLFELDAASNRGVDSVRELVERTAVGSPGRTKVYILDEVHMLTKEASNALLKTLEEPPEHVRFVLATTDPQKVLPTIRSRTQHFDFHLLSAAELTDHVRWVVDDAGLDVDEEAIAYAVRRGRGSVRDTLSALDQVVAAGGITQRSEPVEALFEAIAARDSGKALLAVAEAVNAGHDPRVLAEAFVGEVRDAFLASLGVDTPHLIDTDAQRLQHWADELGSAGLTSALERVGTALVDMRNAADPRVPLEVALVQLTSAANTGGSDAGADDLVASLARRIEALESASQRRSGGSSPGAGSADAGSTSGGVAAARAALADARGSSGSSAGSGEGSGSEPKNASAPEPEAAGTPEQSPSREPGPSPEPPSPEQRAPQPRPAAGAAGTQQRSGRKKPPPPPPRRRGSARPPQRGPEPEQPTARAAERAEDRPAPSTETAPSPRPDPAPETRPPEPAQQVEPEPAEPQAAPASPAPSSGAAATGSSPDRDALVMAFGDVVVPQLKGIAKALFSGGRFVSVEGGTAVFALDNGPTRDRAEKSRPEVESKLSEHFGTTVSLELVTEADPRAKESSGAAPDPRSGRDPGDQVGQEASSGQSNGTASAVGPTVDVRDEEEDLTAPVEELEDADVGTSGVERLAAAFPGAELIETEDPQ